MTAELNWLVLTCLVTALFWMPYVLNRIAVRGLIGAMKGGADEGTPHSPWADRARKAHYNAVENLVLFAALILVAHVAGVSNEVTVTAAMIYFYARVVHYLVTVFGIPFVRTLSFAIGWMCVMALALTLLGVL